MKRILVIAGGGKKPLKPFEEEGERLGLEVKIASFSDMHYGFDSLRSLTTRGSTAKLFVCETPLSDFGLIYIRLVGRRYEDLAILVNEAKKLKIPVVDRAFTESNLARLPIAKSLEIRLLAEAGLPVPKTIFDRLSYLFKKAPEAFDYPFVLKSSTGKQGHGVWAPRNENEFAEIIEKLSKEEKEGKRFLAQEFVKAPKRVRVLVIGDRVIGAIQRPTKWRKRFSHEVIEKKALYPIPDKVRNLAVEAARALMLDIAGVDILIDPEPVSGSARLYVLEVNSAPLWEAIKRDCGVNVEAEILKFLEKRIT